MSERTFVYLTKPHGKNWGIQIISSNPKAVVRFKETCYSNLDRKSNWFHQCNEREYQFFEFWTDDHDLILAESMKIAERMGMELMLEEPSLEAIRSIALSYIHGN